jgi:hypothetical protein
MVEPVGELGVGAETGGDEKEGDGVECEDEGDANPQQNLIGAEVLGLLVLSEIVVEKVDQGPGFCASVEGVADAEEVGVHELQFGHQAAEEEEGSDDREGQGQDGTYLQRLPHRLLSYLARRKAAETLA